MNDIERKLKQAHLVKTSANDLRADLLTVEKRIRDLRGVISPLGDNPAVDMPELAANIMLAFRHVEDARMRLGKAIQALEGGVSIFDNATLPFPLTPSGSPRAHEGEPYPSPF